MNMIIRICFSVFCLIFSCCGIKGNYSKIDEPSLENLPVAMKTSKPLELQPYKVIHNFNDDREIKDILQFKGTKNWTGMFKCVQCSQRLLLEGINCPNCGGKSTMRYEYK